MTPYELNILLDVYVGQPIQADAGAQIFDETLAGLCERGWIVPGGRHVTHLPTEKLQCFMKHVLELPEPVWRMP